MPFLSLYTCSTELKYSSCKLLYKYSEYEKMDIKRNELADNNYILITVCYKITETFDI